MSLPRDLLNAAVNGDKQKQLELAEHYLKPEACKKFGKIASQSLALTWIRIAKNNKSEDDAFNPQLNKNIDTLHNKLVRRERDAEESKKEYVKRYADAKRYINKSTVQGAKKAGPLVGYCISNPNISLDSALLLQLGHIFEVLQHREIAEHWYLAAAGNGNPEACNILKTLRAKKEEFIEAIHWGIREQIYTITHFNPALHLELGYEELARKNFTEAFHYFALVANRSLEAYCLQALIYSNADENNPYFDLEKATECHTAITMRLGAKPSGKIAKHYQTLSAHITLADEKKQAELAEKKKQAIAQNEESMRFIDRRGNQALKDYHDVFATRLEALTNAQIIAYTGLYDKKAARKDEHAAQFIQNVATVAGGAIGGGIARIFTTAISKKHQNKSTRFCYFMRTIKKEGIDRNLFIELLATKLTIAMTHLLNQFRFQSLTLTDKLWKKTGDIDLDTAAKRIAYENVDKALDIIMESKEHGLSELPIYEVINVIVKKIVETNQKKLASEFGAVPAFELPKIEARVESKVAVAETLAKPSQVKIEILVDEETQRKQSGKTEDIILALKIDPRMIMTPEPVKPAIPLDELDKIFAEKIADEEAEKIFGEWDDTVFSAAPPVKPEVNPPSQQSWWFLPRYFNTGFN